MERKERIEEGKSVEGVRSESKRGFKAKREAEMGSFSGLRSGCWESKKFER